MKDVYADQRRKTEKEERAFKMERQRLLGEIRELAKTKYGKSFLWEVLSMCGLYTTTFTGNSQGAFLEGRRSVGLDVLALLEEADKNIYPTLLLDHRKAK